MPSLSTNTYGKARVRLVKVRRGDDQTELLDWTIRILFEGDYQDAYRFGDNSGVLPTDTMKNTVYSLARASSASSPEAFALELTTHFLRGNPEAEYVSVEIAAKPWEHAAINGSSHPSTFRLAGEELQTAAVRASRTATEIRSGIRHLVIMKTADSGFEGFKKDSLTTLPETADRLLGTDASAEWSYTGTPTSFRGIRQRVREMLLKTFAAHQSRSVQHTLYAMGEAVLHQVPELSEIRLTMPNLHCLLVDLSRFGQDNPNEIFVPVDEPHGFIEATIRR
jgi:urate oxidase